MKNLAVLILSSTLLISHHTYADKPIHPVKLKKAAPVRVNELELKQIMQALYQSQVIEPPAHMKNADHYPQSLYTDKTGQPYLLTMLPILKYQDDAPPAFAGSTEDDKKGIKEDYYLVMVAKNPIYDGSIQGCRACSPDADFHIFREEKPRSSHKFLRVKSKYNLTDLPGSDGQLKIDYKALQSNIQPFGQRLMGSYFKLSFMGSGGIEMSNWYALHLNQDNGASILQIAEAGHDNRSYYADRPKLSSNTTSTLQIMKNDAEYYPLNIQYKKQSGLSKSVQTTNIRVGYDVNQQQYVELPQTLKK